MIAIKPSKAAVDFVAADLNKQFSDKYLRELCEQAANVGINEAVESFIDGYSIEAVEDDNGFEHRVLMQLEKLLVVRVRALCKK